jgi:hypothetical protein
MGAVSVDRTEADRPRRPGREGRPKWGPAWLAVLLVLVPGGATALAAEAPASDDRDRVTQELVAENQALSERIPELRAKVAASKEKQAALWAELQELWARSKKEKRRLSKEIRQRRNALQANKHKQDNAERAVDAFARKNNAEKEAKARKRAEEFAAAVDDLTERLDALTQERDALEATRQRETERLKGEFDATKAATGEAERELARLEAEMPRMETMLEVARLPFDPLHPCQTALPRIADEVDACIWALMPWEDDQRREEFPKLLSDSCYGYRELYPQRMYQLGIDRERARHLTPSCDMFAEISERYEEKITEARLRSAPFVIGRVPAWLGCRDPKPESVAYVKTCIGPQLAPLFNRAMPTFENVLSSSLDLAVLKGTPDDPECRNSRRQFEWGFAGTLPERVDLSRLPKASLPNRGHADPGPEVRIPQPDCAVLHQAVKEIYDEYVPKVREKRAEVAASIKKLQEINARRWGAENQILHDEFWASTPEREATKFSSRERELMVSPGRLDPPDDYAEPTGEEIRLAMVREYVARAKGAGYRANMVDGDTAYILRNILPFGDVGTVVEFGPVTKPGPCSKRSGHPGYMCLYESRVSWDMDGFSRERVQDYSAAVTGGSLAPADLLDVGIRSLDAATSSRRYHWFVLGPSGWRQPFTEEEQAALDAALNKRAEEASKAFEIKPVFQDPEDF